MKKLFIIALFSVFVSADEIDLENFSTSLDYAQVTKVRAAQSTDGSWCFDAQVRHNDEGWDHYADGWQITDLQGNELNERILAHPHDNEQPFTRGLCNINIPNNLSSVVVRAKCNQHGYGGQAILVDLTQSKGKGFTVKRQQ